jgi:hypothetical protein
VPADIKVDYGQPKGCLLIAEAGNIEAISGPVDGHSNHLHRNNHSAYCQRNPSRLRDRVALVGCGLADIPAINTNRITNAINIVV